MIELPALLAWHVAVFVFLQALAGIVLIPIIRYLLIRYVNKNKDGLLVNIAVTLWLVFNTGMAFLAVILFFYLKASV